MKKLGLLVMPLMAISLLVNCGGNNTPQTVEHVVTFESNGGTHVNTQKVKDGETATEPNPVPEKTYYTFVGWFISPDFAGGGYDFNTPVTEDITLYADWNGGPSPVIKTYSIEFQGTNCTSTLDTSKQYNTDEKVNFTINLPNGGYKLPENINVSGVSTFDYSSQTGAVSFTVESKDIGVIAIAETIEPTIQHTVAFVLNGATSDPIAPVKVNDGDHYPSDKIPTNPTKEGHTFEGWSDKENTKSIVDLSKATINSDLILYAWWSDAQKVKITFDADGGYFDGDKTKTTVDVDTTYGQIPVAPTPTKVVEGISSTFDGWNKTLEVATTETTYTAQWDDVTNKCHVTFNANGGTIIEGDEAIDVDYGSTIPSTSVPKVTRQGYGETTRWNDASGKEFKFGETTVIDHMTLYARWGEAITHKITIAGDHIQSGSPLIFEHNKFDSISYTFGVVSGYKLTGGYSVNPADSATVEIIDTRTISITPKINNDITITLDTEEDIRHYYNITTSGQHISYFKDLELTIPLSQVPACIYEDLVFYMIGDHDKNDLYSPPSSLDIKAAGISIPYTIVDLVTSKDKITKEVTIEKENITGDITINGSAIKAKCSVTGSGEKMKYYKDETMTTLLDGSSAYIFEDFTFYMSVDYVENSEAYAPPTSLNIKMGALSVTDYVIQDITGHLLQKKVTIKTSSIIGGFTNDIAIKGDAAQVGYYKIDTPYFFGLNPITVEETYCEYSSVATIKFKAESSFEYNDDLLTTENIFVSLTGKEDVESWQSPSDTGPVKFEHTGNDYILTIIANAVQESTNVIKIIARAKAYHQILDFFEWSEINAISKDQNLMSKLFSVGDTKTVELTDGSTNLVRIIDFNKDADENGNKVAITFDFASPISDFTTYWNNKDGDSSKNYDFINRSNLNDCLQPEGTIYEKLNKVDGLMSVIKTVTKYVETSTDDGKTYKATPYNTKLFPLSIDEIDGKDGSYEYYKTDSHKRRIKGGVSYWLRSPQIHSVMKNGAWRVDEKGETFGTSIPVFESALAVAPAFCI